MSEQIFRPYLGSGKVYGRIVGSAAPLRELGNVSELKIKTEEDVKELTDNTSSGGGTYAEVRRVKSASASMTLHDLNRANLAMALRAASETVASGTVTDEPQTAYQSGLVRLAHPQPTSVVVTDTGGSTTYVEGTDYEVRQGGVFILDGSITDGTAIKVSYAHAGYDVIEALTESTQELELSFDGMNEADSDKPVVVDIYKLSLAALGELSLIGDDFGGLALEGKLLKDLSKTGSGKSKYFKVSQQ